MQAPALFLDPTPNPTQLICSQAGHADERRTPPPALYGLNGESARTSGSTARRAAPGTSSSICRRPGGTCGSDARQACPLEGVV